MKPRRCKLYVSLLFVLNIYSTLTVRKSAYRLRPYWIMGRRDLHCTSPELHIDSNRICHNGHTAVDEGVDSKFTMKVL